MYRQYKEKTMNEIETIYRTYFKQSDIISTENGNMVSLSTAIFAIKQAIEDTKNNIANYGEAK